QVRILDLARQLIRIAGLREGEDIEIAFTGLRPGEKLYEELHTASERARMTRHERILKWELDAIDAPRLLAGVAELESAAVRNDVAAIRRLLYALVPEFQERVTPTLERAPATAVVELPATPAPSVATPPATQVSALAKVGAQPGPLARVGATQGAVEE